MAEGESFKYRGFAKTVNEKPEEGIALWASDWNKDYFGFYGWVDKDDYKSDLTGLNGLIKEQNWRDGDVYVELIDHTPCLGGFYDFLYDRGYDSHWDALDCHWWDVLAEKGDEHFQVYREINAESGTLEEVLEFEYSSFSDEYEFLETFHPELYRALEEAHALDCFDTRGFTRCQSGILWRGDGSVVVDE